jgi:hypothetical protein
VHGDSLCQEIPHFEQDIGYRAGRHYQEQKSNVPRKAYFLAK